MNLLANLSASYAESRLAGDVTGINETEREGNPSGSPYSEMIGSLQALKQNDPTLFERVRLEVVASLKAANGGIDIPGLIKHPQIAPLHSVLDRLNRLASLVLPGSGEPMIHWKRLPASRFQSSQAA
jgi:hypothetical protein